MSKLNDAPDFGFSLKFTQTMLTWIISTRIYRLSEALPLQARFRGLCCRRDSNPMAYQEIIANHKKLHDGRVS
jgi:hypothetical protein